MKILIKKNLIVFREPYDWYELAGRLRSEYGLSIMLISSKCKRELGFTVRHHKGLVKWEDDGQGWLNKEFAEAEFKNRYYYEEQVHLDFYNEAQMTMFVLKYLNTGG